MGKKGHVALPAVLRDPAFVKDCMSRASSSELMQKYPGQGSINVYRALRRTVVLGHELAAEKSPSFRERLQLAQVNPPVDAPAVDPEKDELRHELSILREQLVWAQRSGHVGLQGGRYWLVQSDDHYGDRAHMLNCAKNLWQKTLLTLGHYEPSFIGVLSNGDKVAGRGIYREQNMDSVCPDTESQLKIAAYKVAMHDRELKERHPKAVIQWQFTRGNHDRNMGEPLTEFLVHLCRALGVGATYCGDSTIINLASQGHYYLYAEHGYGYSGISPSSPKWLSDMKDKLLRLGRTYYGPERIRRVTHGHTHWMALNRELARDLYIDTTGGLQRNERVLLGKNERPIGWIAYISPPDAEDILAPLPIQPDLEIVELETADPRLFERNMHDAGEALSAYRVLAQGLGVHKVIEPEGR